MPWHDRLKDFQWNEKNKKKTNHNRNTWMDHRGEQVEQLNRDKGRLDFSSTYQNNQQKIGLSSGFVEGFGQRQHHWVLWAVCMKIVGVALIKLQIRFLNPIGCLHKKNMGLK